MFLQTIKIQVESTFSSSAAVKARRTQSMRASALKPELNVNVRPVSHSSTSSTSSITSLKDTDSKSMASTSGFKENEFHPLAEKSKHVSFTEADLREVSAQTHNDVLDPTRDGVYARMQRILTRYGSAAVVGTAIGVGGGLAADHFLNQNNKTQVVSMNTTHNLSNQTEFDSIFNPL